MQTASLAALVAGGFNNATEEMYTATKWAVLGWTRSLGKPETFAREGVRVMAVCPWVVDTPLVRSDDDRHLLPTNNKLTLRAAVATMSEAERAAKINSPVHKRIQPAEVAVAVEQLVRRGRPGDAVTVGPDLIYFYPDIQRNIFLVYKLVHSLLCRLGLASPTTAVTTSTLWITLGFLAFLAAMLLHFVLRWAGL